MKFEWEDLADGSYISNFTDIVSGHIYFSSYNDRWYWRLENSERHDFHCFGFYASEDGCKTKEEARNEVQKAFEINKVRILSLVEKQINFLNKQIINLSKFKELAQAD